jgi:signal peptide peptidase SppA
MYDRLISLAMRTPWALEPSKLAVIADLLRFRASGGRLSAEEIQARIGDAPEQPRPSTKDGLIAVIPIFGVITHRANSFDAMSGGTSAELLGKYIRKAVNDDSVKAILLDISSPGGEVSGIPELAAEIAAAAKVKTVVASSNALAASAAYWLGSQATEFVITPSGYVGSIGVYLLTEDLSEHLAKEGIKINAISAGDNKLEGAPWEPMSDETRAFLQTRVDGVYAEFVRAVASGRSVSKATVEADFGQGRVFNAKEALKRGMVDAIETMDGTIARLVKKAPKGYRSRTAASAETIATLATLGEIAAAKQADVEVEIAESLVHTSIPVSDALAAAMPTSMDATAPLEAVAEDIGADPIAADAGAVVETPAVDPSQLAADQDYIDAGIRIAERL